VDSSRHEQSSDEAAVAKATGTPLSSTDVVAERLLTVVSAVSRLLRREMRRNAGDLTVPQFRALLFIERHPATDLSRLAIHLGMSRSSASALVERLAKAGYVSRSTNPDERRRIRIEVEQPGTLAVAEAAASTRAWLAEELTSFTPAERRSLAGSLDLLARIGERRAEP
jgi:DNA-binding MarR family transcriptional regulator